MFCLYTSRKLSHPKFEFSLKVKVMKLNPGYLLRPFLLYFYFTQYKKKHFQQLSKKDWQLVFKSEKIFWRFLETNKHCVVLLARPFGLLAGAAAATPASLGSSTTLLGQLAKSRQKWDSKNSWNWLVILMTVTVWQISYLKRIQWPEMEVKQILWNLIEKIREITSSKLIFGGF